MSGWSRPVQVLKLAPFSRHPAVVFPTPPADNSPMSFVTARRCGVPFVARAYGPGAEASFLRHVRPWQA